MNLETIFLRLILSTILGGIFGLERELRSKPAGFITLILVSLGATAIALIHEELVMKKIEFIKLNPHLISGFDFYDVKLPGQVITGVGFIGGGVIIYNKDKISGLTTAALLWITAAMGLAIGYGFIFLSFSIFFIVIITLILMRLIEEKYIFKLRKKILKKADDNL
ncbi:MAG: MgtC/SapB family protein [Cetobacterium sp.]|nr:MgtC/SapB family protein [Cetobacterium sp.]